MPLRVAARKCPDAVFLPVDREAYDAASARGDGRRCASLEWGGVPVVVEVLGWDEAFLAAGTPGTATWATRATFAAEIRAAVLAATRLHCSVGIGDNKLRAKIATDFGKPRGRLAADRRRNWFEVMGERPTDALWGIGRKTAQEAGRARHRHGRPARRRPTPGVLAARARPDDGPVVPPARPRRGHQPGRRRRRGCPGRTAGRRPPGGPGGLGPRWRRRCARSRVRVVADIDARGPAGRAGRPQGAVRAVHHRHAAASPCPSRPTTRRCSPTPRCRCSSGSTQRPRRCGCSACGSRWCRSH